MIPSLNPACPILTMVSVYQEFCHQHQSCAEHGTNSSSTPYTKQGAGSRASIQRQSRWNWGWGSLYYMEDGGRLVGSKWKGCTLFTKHLFLHYFSLLWAYSLCKCSSSQADPFASQCPWTTVPTRGVPVQTVLRRGREREREGREMRLQLQSHSRRDFVK